jgi:predicted TIM-barrel fold metal-dependent hydrolase
VRVVAVEEHFAAPEITRANAGGEWATRIRELGDRGLRLGTQVIEQLADVDAGRLAAMDAAGIDVQVLSHTQPSVESLPPGDAVALAAATNDFLAAAIARHRDRFSGFAVLPTPDPEAAADELERAVTKLGLKGGLTNGRTAGRFLDDRRFWPIFERAEKLAVPIYIHPGLPPAAVRDAYYGGLAPAAAHWLSIAAWGWHVETGLHGLRLIAAGVFDRFPKLQVIIGHMGEAIPFMLERTNSTLSREVTGLDREVKDYFRQNFYVTTSGFFSYPPLLCLLALTTVDRVMFAVDYPYSSNEEGRTFIDGLPLNREDKDKIVHTNAERLLGL